MENHKELNDLKCELQKKIVLVRVIGNSMTPLVKDGDTAIVGKLRSLQSLKRFDIVVFWQKDRFVCHYFWQMNEHFNESFDNPTVITRPLNPLTGYDFPIKYKDIAGVVLNIKLSFLMKVKIVFLEFIKIFLNRD